jgi:hypothetical protein
MLTLYFSFVEVSLLVKCYTWSRALCGTETWTLRKVRQKYMQFFLNVVLEKDGEDQTDRSCEK